MLKIYIKYNIIIKCYQKHTFTQSIHFEIVNNINKNQYNINSWFTDVYIFYNIPMEMCTAFEIDKAPLHLKSFHTYSGKLSVKNVSSTVSILIMGVTSWQNGLCNIKNMTLRTPCLDVCAMSLINTAYDFWAWCALSPLRLPFQMCSEIIRLAFIEATHACNKSLFT